MSKPRKISDYPNRADDYEEAVSKSHDQNTDIALDEGGDNEVTAEAIRDHVDSTDNPHGVTAEQVGAYTKGETDDLLDGKADQSALNATNQAVAGLDDRVGTAEDGIAGLESSKADLNGGNTFEGDQMIPTSNLHNLTLKKAGHDDLSVTGQQYILLARSDNPSQTWRGRVSGTLYGASYNFTTIMISIVQITDHTDNDSLQMAYSFDSNLDLVTPARVECDYDGQRYYAIRLTGSPNTMPNYWGWVGSQSGTTLPFVVPSSLVSNVSTSPSLSDRGTISRENVDRKVFSGTVTASDFITQSRVESDRKNALSALDNISEWKKKDGTIDYKKHYAYTPRIVKDESGKVIEEVPGFSLEKRVAMMEKMICELRDRNEDLQAKLNNTKRN